MQYSYSMYNVVTRKVSDGVLRHFKCMHYYSLLGNDLNSDRGYIWSHTSVSTLILHTHTCYTHDICIHVNHLNAAIMRHWYVL